MQRKSCCFTGHTISKLKTDEATIKKQLKEKIEISIKEGFDTFITGMATGVDIYAGEIVVEIKQSNPEIKLIAAIPWEGQADKWDEEWKEKYNVLLSHCDEKEIINKNCEGYHRWFYHVRDRWMVDHSDRVIAFYNGTPGGTKYTIDYAVKKGKELIIIDEKVL